MVNVSPRQFYEELISQMPHGLERALLRVLSYHIGKDKAISKPDLLADLARMGFRVHERQARKAIEELRNNGHLIGASSGDGGYYIIANEDEYNDYVAEETSRATKILERLRAQDAQAKKVFSRTSAVAQASLF